jgi:hypothetical protein
MYRRREWYKGGREGREREGRSEGKGIGEGGAMLFKR